MKTNVRGKGSSGGVTDGIRASVEKASAKLEKYVSGNAELSVAVGAEGNRHTAELMLRDGSTFMRVEETGTDIYNVIHDAGEMMERKLRKYKEKIAARREGRPTTRAVARRVGDVLAEQAEADSEPDTEIRRIKRFGIKPMFPEDAVLEMELLDHDFFVFMNAEEKCEVNVIYRRKNGGYGLIQPTFE